MARNRQSAKQAGARFERLVSDYLRDNLDDRIDRKVRTGARDTGDIANVRDSHNRRIAVEVKDYGGRVCLAEWIKEAHQEAENDGAHVGLVVAKRRGTTAPGKQWVAMTVDDLIRLLKDPAAH